MHLPPRPPIHRRAHGGRLTGRRDVERSSGDVCADLHEQLVPFGQTAACDDPIDGDAGSIERFDDRRASRTPSIRAVPGRCRRGVVARVAPTSRPPQLGIDEDRAIAVPPVEGKQPALARPERPASRSRTPWTSRPSRGRRSWTSGGVAVLDEPREDVADRRLTGLVAEQARHDPVLDDAAHALGSRRADRPARGGTCWSPSPRPGVPGRVTPTAGTDTCASTLATATGVPGAKTGPARRFRRETARPPSERRDVARHLVVDDRPETRIERREEAASGKPSARDQIALYPAVHAFRVSTPVSRQTTQSAASMRRSAAA